MFLFAFCELVVLYLSGTKYGSRMFLISPMFATKF